MIAFKVFCLIFLPFVKNIYFLLKRFFKYEIKKNLILIRGVFFVWETFLKIFDVRKMSFCCLIEFLLSKNYS